MVNQILAAAVAETTIAAVELSPLQLEAQELSL
jgi:hypothetical protein